MDGKDPRKTYTEVKLENPDTANVEIIGWVKLSERSPWKYPILGAFDNDTFVIADGSYYDSSFTGSVIVKRKDVFVVEEPYFKRLTLFAIEAIANKKGISKTEAEMTLFESPELLEFLKTVKSTKEVYEFFKTWDGGEDIQNEKA